MILFASLLVLNIPYSIYSRVQDRKFCAAIGVKTPFTQFYSWFSLCISSVIPFSIILIMNILIICAIRKRKELFKDTNNKELTETVPGRGCSAEDMDQAAGHMATSRKGRVRESQLTTILLLVSFVLLILTLPQYIRYTIYVFVNYKFSHKVFANYILAYHITNKLYFTNNACNFYLYCIGGSKFRSDVKRLLCRYLRERRFLSEKSGSTSATSSL